MPCICVAAAAGAAVTNAPTPRVVTAPTTSATADDIAFLNMAFCSPTAHPSRRCVRESPASRIPRRLVLSRASSACAHAAAVAGRSSRGCLFCQDQISPSRCRQRQTLSVGVTEPAIRDTLAVSRSRTLGTRPSTVGAVVGRDGYVERVVGPRPWWRGEDDPRQCAWPTPRDSRGRAGQGVLGRSRADGRTDRIPDQHLSSLVSEAVHVGPLHVPCSDRQDGGQGPARSDFLVGLRP